VIQWQVDVMDGRVSSCCGSVVQHSMCCLKKSTTNRINGVWALA